MIKRTANALLTDVALSPLADAYFRWSTLGLGNAELEWLQKKLGGLWVGGTLTASNDAITFEAKGFNKVLQTGTLQLTIPMGVVSAVAVGFGILTKIIDVTYGDPPLRTSFRCFGAQEVANYIQGNITRSKGR